jgi:uncharacterized short protein YbdD (DUF466 family)
MRGRGQKSRLADGQVGRWAGRRTALLSWLPLLRQVLGMPNYQEYVRHLAQCHPERPVPTEREYFDQYVQSRYQSGGARCC